MKYNAKKMLLVAAGMGITGVLLSLCVGIVTGKTSIETNGVDWFDWLDNNLEKDLHISSNSQSKDWVSAEDFEMNKLQDKITKTYPASIQGIDLEVNLGDVTVKRNSTDETVVHVTPRAYQDVEIKLEENEIKIDISSRKQFSNIEGAFVEILVGKNVVLQDSNFEIALGDLTMDNIVLQDSDITLSLGDLVFKGDLINENKIESSLGDVNLTLLGKKSEYRWNLQNSMGSILVDGAELSGFMSSATKEGSGKNYIEVESSMGDTLINFN